MQISADIIGREGDIVAYTIRIAGKEYTPARKHLVEDLAEAFPAGTEGDGLLSRLEHYANYARLSADLDRVTLGRVLERVHACLRVESEQRGLTVRVAAVRELVAGREHCATFFPILVVSRTQPATDLEPEADRMIRAMFGEAELRFPH